MSKLLRAAIRIGALAACTALSGFARTGHAATAVRPPAAFGVLAELAGACWRVDIRIEPGPGRFDEVMRGRGWSAGAARPDTREVMRVACYRFDPRRDEIVERVHECRAPTQLVRYRIVHAAGWPGVRATATAARADERIETLFAVGPGVGLGVGVGVGDGAGALVSYRLVFNGQRTYPPTHDRIATILRRDGADRYVVDMAIETFAGDDVRRSWPPIPVMRYERLDVGAASAAHVACRSTK